MKPATLQKLAYVTTSSTKPEKTDREVHISDICLFPCKSNKYTSGSQQKSTQRNFHAVDSTTNGKKIIKKSSVEQEVSIVDVHGKYLSSGLATSNCNS